MIFLFPSAFASSFRVAPFIRTVRPSGSGNPVFGRACFRKVLFSGRSAFGWIIPGQVPFPATEAPPRHICRRFRGKVRKTRKKGIGVSEFIRFSAKFYKFSVSRVYFRGCRLEFPIILSRNRFFCSPVYRFYVALLPIAFLPGSFWVCNSFNAPRELVCFAVTACRATLRRMPTWRAPYRRA